LSPAIDTLDQIKTLSRVQETPTEGPLHDILWSEPGEAEGKVQEKTFYLRGKGWQAIPTGPGYYFSQDVTRKFFHINNLKMLCRGHQYVEKVSQSFFSQYLFF